MDLIVIIVITIVVLICLVFAFKSSSDKWRDKYQKEICSLKQDLDRKNENILKSKRAADASIEKLKTESASQEKNYKLQLQDLSRRSDELDKKKSELSDFEQRKRQELRELEDDLRKELSDLERTKKKELSEFEEKFRKDLADLERQKTQELAELEDDLQKDHYIRRLISEISLCRNLLEEKAQTYPWIATLFSQYQKERDDYEASLLSRRATTSREIVKVLKDQNAELKYRSSIAENQILLYESLFPWLEEFKTSDIDSAVEYIRSTNKGDDYDSVRNWLSPEEYVRLSTSEKNQLALERYLNRHKSDWEIGIEYERFVGYQYEIKGYRVKYSGATEGTKDMGRDLICEKNGLYLVVQCKRWSDKKTIHEKHIFQLFGSTMQIKYENPDKVYHSLFVTSTKLSDLAKLCAQQLEIQVVENYLYKDYPRIKCNIGRDGEKIYHLPFDQQYDRVVIDFSKGERYAMTVKEAESYGFRRAFKHYL